MSAKIRMLEYKYVIQVHVQCACDVQERYLITYSQQWTDEGLVNGALGVIQQIGSNNIIVGY